MSRSPVAPDARPATPSPVSPPTAEAVRPGGGADPAPTTDGTATGRPKADANADGQAPGTDADAPGDARPEARAGADSDAGTGAAPNDDNDHQAPGAEADAPGDARPEARAGADVGTDAGTGAAPNADQDRQAPRTEAGAHADDEATGAGADAPAPGTEADAHADAQPNAHAHPASDTGNDRQAPRVGADVRADGEPNDDGAGAEPGDADEAERRPRGVLGTVALVCGLALMLTAGGIVVGAGTDGQSTRSTATRTVDTPVMGLANSDLNTAISGLQTHLRAQPKDGASWATLGAAYVEQARTSGDPTRYPQAEEAFDRSMTIQPRDNDSALAGRAALAAARHDFDTALRYADRALTVNPYSERALSVRIDALVELGRYDDAYAAAERADSLRPGIPVFTRLAYVKELRGDPAGSRKVLLIALDQAASTGDIAYVATALGHLAWEQGDYTEALKRYGDALRVSPDYIPALEGRGRTLAARGDLDGALRDLSEVVQRYPLPAELAALGEVYEVMGQQKKASQHYSVVGTWIALARANGVATDLDTALVAADHGDPAEALRAARAEWSRRHSVHTADAMAWALHVNGKDEEALGYAKQALAPGYRNALFLYHRGMIERALGDRTAARKSLADAMELNPGFSPTGAKAARQALKDLGGAEAAR